MVQNFEVPPHRLLRCSDLLIDDGVAREKPDNRKHRKFRTQGRVEPGLAGALPAEGEVSWILAPELCFFFYFRVRFCQNVFSKIHPNSIVYLRIHPNSIVYNVSFNTRRDLSGFHSNFMSNLGASFTSLDE